MVGGEALGDSGCGEAKISGISWDLK